MDFDAYKYTKVQAGYVHHISKNMVFGQQENRLKFYTYIKSLKIFLKRISKDSQAVERSPGPPRLLLESAFTISQKKYELNRGKKSILTEDNTLFASKAKINVFEIFSSGASLKETHSEEFFFKKH